MKKILVVVAILLLIAIASGRIKLSDLKPRKQDINNIVENTKNTVDKGKQWLNENRPE